MKYDYLLLDGSSGSTEAWETIYKTAREDVDNPLHSNYTNINLQDYERMIIHMDGTTPAAFHGIYNNGRWQSNVSRVCNRMYTARPYRDVMSTIAGDSARYDFANYELWGKDVLFISRGIQYDNVEISFKKFHKFVAWLERVTDVKLAYDEYLYSCCSANCRDCYQFCVWYDPKNMRDTLDIPRITWDEFNLLPK
jgi:hypothetical protein